MSKSKVRQQMLFLATRILAARNASPLLAERLGGDQATSDDVKAIISIVADELCENGIGDDSEPTAYGLELEHLIDFLNGPNIKIY